MSIDTKTCTKCKHLKDISQFYKDKKGKGGFHAACKKCHNNRAKQRFQTDISTRMIRLARSRFKRVCKQSSFSKVKEEILGCSIIKFKEYIARQFSKNMTWENMGNRESGWCIDHIIPVSIMRQYPNKQHLIFNYRNHQPLSFIDNETKKANLEIARLFLITKINHFGNDEVYQEMLEFITFLCLDTIP